MILRVEVTHAPAYDGWPAHIRVTGHSAEGPFTLRKITGLRTDRIAKKMAEARAIFEPLVGLEVDVVTRAPRKEGNPPVRVVKHTTLPAWALGKWAEVA